MWGPPFLCLTPASYLGLWPRSGATCYGCAVLVGRGRSHCADGTGKQEGRRGATSVAPFLLRGPLAYLADRPTGTGGSSQVTLPKGRPALGGECPPGVLPSMSQQVEACWTPSMVGRQKPRLTNPNVSLHIPAGL